MSTGWIVIGVIVIIALFAFAAYNRLVALSQRVSQAFADIDVQLKQRHDLIPNLVETVKGYASHERGTLDDVIKARNSAMSAQGPGQVAAAENQLSGALGRLIALSEAYPELKANANFQQLANELSDLENKIAASRRFFNNAVQEYNTGIQQMPAALFAGLFLLVYVIVYAGALIIEVVNNGNASVDYYLRVALGDVIRTLPYSTAAAAAWIVIAYFFHQSIIDAVTGGESVTRQEQPRLYNLLENLCISRGIPMPKLKIMQSDALNAFATGLNQRQYAVTVTTGLLAALNDQEMEAVLGHELTHIRNGDVQMMVVA